MRDDLRPGLKATMTYTVPLERTVPYLLPESAEFATLPEVLATGYLVGIVEWTCMRALAGHLESTERTLGVHVDLSHEAPTPPGAGVTVQVGLIAVEGRRLTFSVRASDDAGVVCRGTHQRAVIDVARFTDKLTARAAGSRGGQVDVAGH